MRLATVILFTAALSTVPAVRAGWFDIIKDKLTSSGQSRTMQGEPSKVAAVRGLGDEMDEKDSKNRNYKPIDKVKTVAISAAELKRFVKEGGLPAEVEKGASK